MKKLKKFGAVFFLFLSLSAAAQIKAVTDSGDEVLLYANGTWKYVDTIKNNDAITVNTKEFKKPADATFLLKSKFTQAGFWLNPKKWSFEKTTVNAAGEYTFSLKENATVMATVVCEPTGMDIKSLRKIALENMQKAASSFKILNEEYRTVNGLKILKIESEATVEGINFNYINYYYSDSLTTIQFLGFTAKNLIKKYSAQIEELLNGFVTEAGFDLAPSTSIQSLLIDNSNCRNLFSGKWSYTANGKKYLDKIENDRIVESCYTDKHKSIYKLRWINDCTYELRLESSSDPSSKLIKKGEPMTVEIMEINDKKMRYQLTYLQSTISGEMTKEDK